jgi:hypothetical protein
VGGVPGADRTVCYLGSDAARERIWFQLDAAAAPQAAAFAAWGAVESLSGARVGRYRHLVLGRSYLAVVGPTPVPTRPQGWGDTPPLFDAGELGASAGVLAALDRFAPTLVVHVQDWTAAGPAGWRAGSAAGSPAPGASGASAGMRLVESFPLDPALHRRLSADRRRRTWLGRPTAEARALAAHPDARLGALVRRYVSQMGYQIFGTRDEARTASDAGRGAAIRLAVGRYAPRLEWRRLGGATLGELCLSRHGAVALCGQVFDSHPVDRAGAALALAEAAVLFRLNLETMEAPR